MGDLEYVQGIENSETIGIFVTFVVCLYITLPLNMKQAVKTTVYGVYAPFIKDGSVLQILLIFEK